MLVFFAPLVLEDGLEDLVHLLDIEETQRVADDDTDWIIMMAPIIWILWRLAKKDRSRWWTFGWMLVLTGIERFFIEFLRINDRVALGLTQPQWVAIASVVIGTTLVLLFRKKPAERVAVRRGASA